MRRPIRLFMLLIAVCAGRPAAHAYSVLTHEAIVDAVWDISVRPLLLQRFPGASAEALKNAHAAAYGGALMPDLGYFPAGSPFFTNLVHYVRSGDFVGSLLREARTIEELGFALGALSHYNADRWGHPLGTNRAVPLIYPEEGGRKSRRTYEEDPLAHKRVEFGFDVLQTARGNYATEAYQDFIGFRFADTLLFRSFEQVYGLRMKDVFGNYGKAVNMLRFSVRDLFPLVTKVAWKNREKEIREKQPGATARNFRYKMHRKRYNQLYSRKEDRPGFFTRILAGIIFVLPKVGPLKPLKFKVPDAAAEKIFLHSFDTVTAHLRGHIAEIAEGKMPQLPDIDFDTGVRTEPGEYGLADQTYRCLLRNVASDDFKYLSPQLKADLLRFFEKKDPASGLQKQRERDRILNAYAALKALP